MAAGCSVVDMIESTDADYARAERMPAPCRARRVPGATVNPQWIADGTRFRCRVGSRCPVVDPTACSRYDAFDHERLAAALTGADPCGNGAVAPYLVDGRAPADGARCAATS